MHLLEHILDTKRFLEKNTFFEKINKRLTENDWDNLLASAWKHPRTI